MMSTKAGGFVVVAVAAVVWMASTGLNQAQQSNSTRTATKVGVVDLVKIFNEYEQTRVLNDKMKELQLELQRQRDAKEEQIQQERTTLDALDPSMPAHNKKRKELRDMVFNLRVWEMTEQDNLSENHRFWVKRTYESIISEISSVAAKQGYDIIITEDDVDLEVQDTKVLIQQLINRKVVYADDAVDITPEVLTNLNDAFKKAGGAATIAFTR
jgi:Skp family chaperone for outer membrane proteins